MHLVVAITPHGFGHAAQVAPVIDALRERLPALQVTLLTRLPEDFLRTRINGEFQLIEHAADFGLIMHSALQIDLRASAAAYVAAHHDWDASVRREAQLLISLVPGLVLADVPYLTLAAARYAGIPAVALCSLNWADIYRWYFSACEEAPRLLQEMESAYRGAEMFLCPEPSMPMTFLDNRISIAPLAQQASRRSAELRERLDIAPDQSVVLVMTGGVDGRFDMERWPIGQGIHWLVSQSWAVNHRDVTPFESLDWTVTDLLASCDAVLGKCGYGTVAECVTNGTPLLYVQRPDWPEERSLTDWLQIHDAGLAVDPQRLIDGRFAALVERARDLSVKTCRPTGAAEAAGLLEQYFLT
ncbi:MAG: hypothetical protein RQ736_01525 [Thiogranum sp.]|nr:hypothetical protein [Thiogranum sp.]